jgi:hypothetical protein
VDWRKCQERLSDVKVEVKSEGVIEGVAPGVWEASFTSALLLLYWFAAWLVLYCCFTAALLLLYCCLYRARGAGCVGGMLFSLNIWLYTDSFTAALLLFSLNLWLYTDCFTAAQLLLYFCFTGVRDKEFSLTSVSILTFYCFTAALLLLYCCFTAASLETRSFHSPLSLY